MSEASNITDVSPKDRKTLGRQVSALVIVCLIAALLVSNMKSFFGIYIPFQMVEQIRSWLSFGLFVLAIALHRQRRKPQPIRIVRTLLCFVSFALLVIGWRFVAGDPTWLAMQNDGFTVSGGFMMLFAGLIVGWLAGAPSAGKK
jgi:hypothetical protein